MTYSNRRPRNKEMSFMPQRSCSRKSWGIVLFYLVVISFYNPTDSGAVEFDESNFDATIAHSELVFVNFYADWCRFSNLLAPIFDEAADKISGVFPDKTKVTLGRVDSDKHSSISSRYKISKYPTLKLIRNGVPVKKEYRGGRTPEAFLEYIVKQMENPIHEFHHLREVLSIDETKRIFIGYMTSNTSRTYDTYRRVAMNLKDDCAFYVGFGEASRTMHPPDVDILAFRPDRTTSVELDETFKGNSENFDEVLTWIQTKCVPLVREITFENAEELTEEGLPFMILFHNPDDKDSIRRYNQVVHEQLMGEKHAITFLTADGKRFAHPLHHLGKSEKDLPLIAIDSFRHMYLFPDASQMDIPGKLKNFIADLHSGKLHREFHYGPDPNSDPSNDLLTQPKGTSPPESTFKKLAPSSNRYTLLKDEF
ncbi:endoplasmic reticulum resident protein 44 isoform X2 [Folsomia candida]|uniref:endoplasmic reticulum resident protein 44 isoform X2 n=1 Tax=Folsomia candida TaxID=158441 RepID=UPI000B8FE814|nr:endoplasmic reticulum resident protein 44 isoform X2 [Folsomia candida]